MAEYDKDYHRSKHQYLHNESYYKARARLALTKYFSGVSKNSQVLEFGCGLGQNIFLLSNRAGYDVSEYARKFCKKKGIKTYDDFMKIPDNSFDVVFSCHVLEHLESPLDNLKQLKTKLKKSGKLVLVLPTEKHKKVNFEPDKNQHLYCWNFRTINNLLSRAGFTVTSNKYLRGKAYRKLLFISRISFPLYRFFTTMAAFLGGNKEMKIVAVKK